MYELKKYIASIFYILMCFLQSFANYYVNSYNLKTQKKYELFSFIASIMPYVTYRLSYKVKLFFYIFCQLFAIVYVYIFASYNVITFYNSIITLSDIILRYNLYWKYIIYMTHKKQETVQFHIFATLSYCAYHIDSQVEHVINRLSFDLNYIVYIVCAGYICIGIFVLKFYNAEEKHILVPDRLNTKRAIVNCTSVFCNNYSMLACLNFTNDSHFSIATIIGSFLILTLNGKLNSVFSYEILRHVSSILMLCISIILYFNVYFTEYVNPALLSVIIGTKYIIFDSIHNVLHITHKKNTIDQYLALETIARACTYICVYMLNKEYSIYTIIGACVVQWFADKHSIKYYNKDIDFLQCIDELEMY